MISLLIFCSATRKLFFGGTAIQKSNPARLTQPNQQNSFVSSRREAANIREIEILCDQETLRSLRHFPDACVILSAQSFLGNRVHLVPQLRQNLNQPDRKMFIQFDLHGIFGMLGTGRSSSAEAAAKAIAARTSSSLSVGKSSMIS